MEIVFQPESAEPAPAVNLRGFSDGHFECVETASAVGGCAAATQPGSDLSHQCGRSRLGPASGGFPLLSWGSRPAPRPNCDLTWRCAGQRIRGCTGAARRRQRPQLALGGTVVFPREFTAVARPPRDGLAVWLDAADAATITRDDAGRVALWKDKSERNRDATQKQPQYRPGYDPAGLNGKPVLRFDEKSATRLELPDLADGRISATMFVVLAIPWRAIPRTTTPACSPPATARVWIIRLVSAPPCPE